MLNSLDVPKCHRVHHEIKYCRIRRYISYYRAWLNSNRNVFFDLDELLDVQPFKIWLSIFRSIVCSSAVHHCWSFHTSLLQKHFLTYINARDLRYIPSPSNKTKDIQKLSVFTDWQSVDLQVTLYVGRRNVQPRGASSGRPRATSLKPSLFIAAYTRQCRRYAFSHSNICRVTRFAENDVTSE